MAIDSPDTPRTRRRFLRIGGAAAAGAAAGAFVRGGSAAATQGQAVIAGVENAATLTTTVAAPVAQGPAFLGTNNDTIGSGVEGDGFVGVYGYAGYLDGYGVISDGALAVLPIPDRNVPPADGTGWLAGDIMSADSDNSLWICVEGGAPGIWQKLGGGTATAGAFHAINPTRVYDSRTPQPAPGRLVAGQNRLVSVNDGRSIDNGAVTVTDLVPAGATAITYNLVAIATSPQPGFLAVTPGDAGTFSASTINWAAPTTIANGGTVKLGGDRQVKVFLGGAPGANADFLIDVTGYYR